MGSKYFGKRLPDLGDLENQSNTAPGYCLYVGEEDGGVSVQLVDADANQSSTLGSGVFLNVNEAEELLQGLTKAVERARSKAARHPRRGVDV